LPVNPLIGTLKTAEQWTMIIQQYRDWYTGCWWVTFGTARRAWAGYGPPSPLLDVPINGHVPTSHYLMWHYNYFCTLKG